MKMKNRINKGLQKDCRLIGINPAAFGWITAKAFLLSLLLLFPVTGCTEVAVNDTDSEEHASQTTNGGEDAVMEQQRNFSDLTMPPIDQEAPENFETATLGMG